MFWDNVKDGMHRLSLTLPIPVSYKDQKTGAIEKAPDRTISIGSYDRYYFYNEAVASMPVLMNDKNAGHGRNIAKVIAGIDDASGMVVEVRVDKGGFTSVRHLQECNVEVVRGIKNGNKIVRKK